MASSSKSLIAIGLAFLSLAIFLPPARALITGNTGNEPVQDRDWPLGTVELANLPTRLAYWEGPPFGGGEYHFLYRGDAAALQEALNLFARIRAPERRLIIKEGAEESFYLKDSNKPEVDAQVDWTFIVWTPRSWHALYNNPKSTFASRDPSGAFRNALAPPTLSVNVAGPDGKGIDWSKVKVPEGLTIIDERATSASYVRDDGSVLRGDVYDLLNSKPIPAAQITLGKLNLQNAYDTAAQVQTDVTGHFELKRVPPGSYRISVSAEGRVTRTLGYDTFGKNTLKQHIAQLAAPVTVRGSVKSTDDKPLSGVKIRSDSILALDGRGYDPTDSPAAVTDTQGNFELKGLPEGYFLLHAADGTHYQLDILHLFGPPSNGMPAKIYDNIAIRMTATGFVKGKVQNADGTPARNANIDISPDGDPIGQWGGSMSVKPDGAFEFNNVPPGKYTLSTMPVRPGVPADPSAKVVNLKAGETLDVTITLVPSTVPRSNRNSLP